MELKKTKKADLENKKVIFFQIGLIIALGLLYSAFEWKMDTSQTEGFKTIGDMEEIEEEIIPITRMMMKPPPPPPKVLTSIIDIVDDDDLADDDLVIEDAEVDEETDVKIKEIYEEGEEYGDYGEDYIFAVVEDMPNFPGGYSALMKWLAENINYPMRARQNKVEGKVFVKFVINTDGSIVNVEVTRGVDPLLDNEAKRVISNMPRWKPGKQRGKPVRCSFTLPINFQLRF